MSPPKLLKLLYQENTCFPQIISEEFHLRLWRYTGVFPEHFCCITGANQPPKPKKAVLLHFRHTLCPLTTGTGTDTSRATSGERRRCLPAKALASVCNGRLCGAVPPARSLHSACAKGFFKAILSIIHSHWDSLAS